MGKQALGLGLALPFGVVGGPGGLVNPIPGLTPAAYFKFNTGITVTGSGVSQWSDQSGNGRHLLQATDANRPALQGDGSILFNGTTHFLKCAPFTLNQPTTVYARLKQVSWTANDRLFDGNSLDTGGVQQITSSPNLQATAGTPQNNSALAVGTYGVICVVFNGASSVFRIDATEVAGNLGAGNMGGYILGARGTDSALCGNIQAKEVALFAAAHDATTRAAVVAYLATL